MLKYVNLAITAFILFLSSNNVFAAFILPPDEYWQVSPPLNYSDVLYAGWNQIKVEKEIEVYNGVDIRRTVCAAIIFRQTLTKHYSMLTTQLC